VDLDSAGQALQRWLGEPENVAPLSSLQRDMHTLKGGARMAEVEPVGDLAHELETSTKAWSIVVTATASLTGCCNKP
jgi:chemotaxis protein histidine kinase CheA